ncbi:MAG: methyltransferase domain-containing protein [Saprospiraceae bacterium]
MDKISNNTHKSFSDKWNKNPDLAFKSTLDSSSEINSWILNRNGFSDIEKFGTYLKDKKRVLDGGCGNGRITALLRLNTPPTSEIVGIDFSSHDIAAQNLTQYSNVSIYQKDLLEDLSELGQFDFIYCQEVLHHTSDPELGFKNLVDILSKEGEIAIYVYKKKAPIREFTDDQVRREISPMGYEEAMTECRNITHLGKTLSDIDVKIDVPKINSLQIEAGCYTIQRFIYHFFMKCFWNNDLTFEENAVINYDWYHPQLCSRHTLKEVRSWFEENDLNILHECVDYYGITVRGKKKMK